MMVLVARLAGSGQYVSEKINSLETSDGQLVIRVIFSEMIQRCCI
jgi:hypothetical protein